MFTESQDDLLPAPVQVVTRRGAVLASGLLGLPVAYSGARNQEEIGWCSVAAIVVSLGFAAWCAIATARSREFRRKKLVWFSLGSIAYVVCLHAIFTLRRQEAQLRASEQSAAFAEAFSIPTQFALFLFAVLLAGCLLFLMSVTESAEA